MMVMISYVDSVVDHWTRSKMVQQQQQQEGDDDCVIVVLAEETTTEEPPLKKQRIMSSICNGNGLEQTKNVNNVLRILETKDNNTDNNVQIIVPSNCNSYVLNVVETEDNNNNDTDSNNIKNSLYKDILELSNTSFILNKDTADVEDIPKIIDPLQDVPDVLRNNTFSGNDNGFRFDKHSQYDTSHIIDDFRLGQENVNNPKRKISQTKIFLNNNQDGGNIPKRKKKSTNDDIDTFILIPPSFDVADTPKIIDPLGDVTDDLLESGVVNEPLPDNLPIIDPLRDVSDDLLESGIANEPLPDNLPIIDPLRDVSDDLLESGVVNEPLPDNLPIIDPLRVVSDDLLESGIVNEPLPDNLPIIDPLRVVSDDLLESVIVNEPLPDNALSNLSGDIIFQRYIKKRGLSVECVNEKDVSDKIYSSNTNFQSNARYESRIPLSENQKLPDLFTVNDEICTTSSLKSDLKNKEEISTCIIIPSFDGTERPKVIDPLLDAPADPLIHSLGSESLLKLKQSNSSSDVNVKSCIKQSVSNINCVNDDALLDKICFSSTNSKNDVYCEHPSPFLENTDPLADRSIIDPMSDNSNFWQHSKTFIEKAFSSLDPSNGKNAPYSNNMLASRISFQNKELNDERKEEINTCVIIPEADIISETTNTFEDLQTDPLSDNSDFCKTNNIHLKPLIKEVFSSLTTCSTGYNTPYSNNYNSGNSTFSNINTLASYINVQNTEVNDERRSICQDEKSKNVQAKYKLGETGLYNTFHKNGAKIQSADVRSSKFSNINELQYNSFKCNFSDISMGKTLNVEHTTNKSPDVMNHQKMNAIARKKQQVNMDASRTKDRMQQFQNKRHVDYRLKVNEIIVIDDDDDDEINLLNTQQHTSTNRNNQKTVDNRQTLNILSAPKNISSMGEGTPVVPLAVSEMPKSGSSCTVKNCRECKVNVNYISRNISIPKNNILPMPDKLNNPFSSQINGLIEDLLVNSSRPNKKPAKNVKAAGFVRNKINTNISRKNVAAVPELVMKFKIINVPSLVIPTLQKHPPIASLKQFLTEFERYNPTWSDRYADMNIENFYIEVIKSSISLPCNMNSTYLQNDGMQNNSKAMDTNAKFFIKPWVPYKWQVKNKVQLDTPVAQFCSQIGMNLVQEYVQTDVLDDLIRFREQNQNVSSIINHLLVTLQYLKRYNSCFSFNLKTCKKCNFKTESLITLAFHLTFTHADGTKYICSFCSFTCSMVPSLITIHMKQVHNLICRELRPIRYFSCRNCFFETDKKFKLIQHANCCSVVSNSHLNQHLNYSSHVVPATSSQLPSNTKKSKPILHNQKKQEPSAFTPQISYDAERTQPLASSAFTPQINYDAKRTQPLSVSNFPPLMNNNAKNTIANNSNVSPKIVNCSSRYPIETVTPNSYNSIQSIAPSNYNQNIAVDLSMPTCNNYNQIENITPDFNQIQNITWNSMNDSHINNSASYNQIKNITNNGIQNLTSNDKNQIPTIVPDICNQNQNIAPTYLPADDKISRSMYFTKVGENYNCLLCSFVCKTKLLMNHHVRIMHKPTNRQTKRTFQCPLCNYCCKRDEYIFSHMTDKHKCDYQIDDKFPFKCLRCNFSTKQKISFVSHVLYDSCDPNTNMSVSASSNVLDINSKDAPNMDLEDTTDMEYIYEHDSVPCSSRSVLEEHSKVECKVLLEHCKVEQPVKVGQKLDDGETEFTCELCNMKIKGSKTLNTHMNWIHNINIDINDVPPLHCQTCSLKFYTEKGLQCHLLVSHAVLSGTLLHVFDTGMNDNKCALCGIQTAKWLQHVEEEHRIFNFASCCQRYINLLKFAQLTDLQENDTSNSVQMKGNVKRQKIWSCTYCKRHCFTTIDHYYNHLKSKHTKPCTIVLTRVDQRVKKLMRFKPFRIVLTRLQIDSRKVSVRLPRIDLRHLF